MSELGDILKKALDPKANEPKPASAAPAPAGKAATGGSDAFSDDKMKAFQSQSANLDAAKKQQADILHTKTHQDLVNAAYKAAEKLGIGPWELLRAAEWGTFTDDRGAKYTGPAIDDIKGLSEAQKSALKGVLGL
jgi:hypothetical protein